ncbi:MAG: ABC transporter permease [Thermoleophilia bacterium]|nr:ABC transporter permease [Thermoleophilia bacterium]
MTTSSATLVPGAAGPWREVVASARAELYRLRRWGAVRVIVGAWLLLTLLFGYVFNYVSYVTGESGFANEGATSTAALLVDLLPRQAPSVMVQGMPMFGGALMMVLGALAAGNGYGWGTWKTIIAQGPRRGAVAAGSLLALGTVVVAVVLLTAALTLVVSTAIAGLEGASMALPEAGRMAAALGLGTGVMGMWAGAGFLLGIVSRNPALSAGLGLVWALVVENLLRGVGGLVPGMSAVTDVLPGTAAGSWVGAFVGTSASGDTSPGMLTVLDGTPAGLLTIAFALGLPALAAWRLVRSDVA